MAEQGWASTADHAVAPVGGGWASTSDHAVSSQPGAGADQETAPEDRGFWSSLYHGAVKPLIDMASSVGQEADQHPLRTALLGPVAAPAAKMLGQMYQNTEQRSQQLIDELKQSGLSTEQQRAHAALAAVRLAQAFPLTMPGGEAGEQMGKQVQKGNYAGASGTLTSLVAPAAVDAAFDAAVPSGRVTVVPKVTNPNPVESAAVQYLASKGVPVGVAASTGNPWVAGVQKLSDSTPLGAGVALTARRAAERGLQAEGADLALRAHPNPMVPEQAGVAVRESLSGTAAEHAADANAAYSDFRKIEQDPASLRPVVTGTKQVDTGVLDAQGKPVMRTEQTTENIPMPVDLTAIKAKLQPIYADMQRWMQPALRNANAGFQAMKSILEGPNTIPASQAEAGLGGLKQLAREGAGRNAGMAKFVVPQLQDAIDSAVRDVNPDALQRLQDGRAATAAQYGTQAVLDDLLKHGSEPVATFRSATYAKDAGVDLLSRIEKEAPGELQKVGAAWIEDAVRKAQEGGGFAGPDGMWARWRDLGPKTRQFLFSADPKLSEDLGKFFLGAKKIAENPNPSATSLVSTSGGSTVLAITHPWTGVPLILGAGALSKILHSSAGVRLLTEGMSMPVTSPGAALAAGRILNMAGKDVQPVAPALPAAAQAQEQGGADKNGWTDALRNYFKGGSPAGS
jgi:hypothetical protein